MCSAPGSGLNRSLQEIGDTGGHVVGNETGFARLLALVDRFAISGHDFGDAIGFDRHALCRNARESARHLDQAHFGRTKHHRREGRNRAGNAKAPRHRSHGPEADFIAKLRCNSVDRVGKGGADIGFADISPVRVARAPSVDCHRGIDHAIIGGVACLKRGEEDEKLPRRARLAHCIGRAVEIGFNVIGAAHQRENCAVAVHADQRALRAVWGIGVNRGRRRTLHPDINRGPDLQRSVGFGQQQIKLRQRPIGEIAHRVLARLLLDRDGVDIDRGLLCGDHLLLAHQAQHDLRTVNRGLHICGGRIAAGCLDQSGDDRGLRNAQFAPGVAEEFSTRAVDAICAAAEIDLVQIELEDLLLRELPFKRHRQHRLPRLAVNGAVGGQEQVARKLLRNGGSAADTRASAHEAFNYRACGSDRVDTEMRMEPLVLDRDHRIAHVFRDFIVCEPFAKAWPDLDDLGPVAGTHEDSLTGLRRFQLIEAGQRLRGKADCKGEEYQAQNGSAAAPDSHALGPFAQTRRALGTARRSAIAVQALLARARAFVGRSTFCRCPARSSLALVLETVTPLGHCNPSDCYAHTLPCRCACIGQL